jgi:hypothetical protein
MFTAVWARKLKGLAGEEVTACASDLRFVSRRGEAIVGMIADDLRRGGVSLSRKDVQHALNRLHRVDLHQAGATDQRGACTQRDHAMPDRAAERRRPAQSSYRCH